MTVNLHPWINSLWTDGPYHAHYKIHVTVLLACHPQVIESNEQVFTLACNAKHTDTAYVIYVCTT